MMGSIFFEITVIVCLAAFLAIIFRALKQPTILAYILTGIIIGPLGLFEVNNQEVFQTMAELGITFLLFMVGLELKLKDLQSVGRVALLTGIGQILFTSFFGYLICLALGFSPLTSLYISVALTFSSTIIIVKLLSDKKDLNSLYGKISVGFLLVQDFFAILALILLSGFNQESLSVLTFAAIVLKALVLFAVIIYLSKSILPRLVDKISHSGEILFLFSIAWVFGMAAFVSSPIVGFSIEIGGFLAGLALANSSENFQIVARVRALRDFFITIFFVILGMKMVFSNASVILPPAILLSLFVLIGNPLIVIAIMSLMGFRRRTAFLAGLTVAQISEFSLIVVFMGNKIGHLSSEVISLVTVVGVITFTFSTYMIVNGNKLYKLLNPYLKIFERKHTKGEQTGIVGEFSGHAILIGANRTGEAILNEYKDLTNEVVVVDFDPDVVKGLKDKGFIALFGDISDPDIQEKAQVDKAKIIISTVPDLEDNLFLLGALKPENRKVKVVVVAQDRNEAKSLYKAGADYVVIPNLSAGRYIAKIIKEDIDVIESHKLTDLSYL
ncbi:sodium:proton exchanger [Candidatus Parcubacteria bacterium]|nr:MAG: sodium:proton exchanger [Candidatus Parcubacteria bacterium]